MLVGVFNKMKKFLFIDVDGVVAKHREPISPEISMRLREISEKAKVVFASGKPASYLTGLARGIGLSSSIVIGENGGTIFFTDSMYEIVFSDFDATIKNNLNVLRIECEKQLRDRCWFQPNRVNVTAFPKKEFSVEKTKTVFDNIIDKHDLEGIKLFVHKDAVEGVPEGLDKSWALDKILKYFEISSSGVIAVGDGVNDIGMLKESGLSLAVGDDSRVREVSDKCFHSGIDALDYIIKILE